jgi:hypothetical protein
MERNNPLQEQWSTSFPTDMANGNSNTDPVFDPNAVSNLDTFLEDVDLGSSTMPAVDRGIAPFEMLAFLAY